MTTLFIKVFNLSITAGWIVIAALVLRPFLKKAPRWISCALWATVALRLVLPFSFESVLSLIPSTEVIPQDGAVTGISAIHSGIPVINNAVNPLFTTHAPLEPSHWTKLLRFAAILWAAVVLILLLYGVLSWVRLRRQVRVSICAGENVRICDDIDSPFILGIFRPGIYVPSGLHPEHLQYVLAHERAHIRRRDHWWKPLGFLLLTLHWFNPLLWVAYLLLCRDIEQACDEKVIRELDLAGKKNYSKALLACSARKRMVMVCPVAFGEVSVKTRIRDILRYKAPRFRIILVAVCLCILAAVCLLTNPLPCEHSYQDQVTLEATCTHQGTKTMTCTECGHTRQVDIPMLSHSYAEGTVTVAPTCTETGLLLSLCTGCGKQRQEVLDKLDHVAGEPVLIQASTCASTGIQEAACIHCGQVCQTLILATIEEHVLEESLLKPATCAAFGEGLLSCQLCDYTETIGYEKTEHRYDKEEYSEFPTCAKDGGIWRICSHCGHKIWRRIPATGEHQYIVLNIYGPRYCRTCWKPEY